MPSSGNSIGEETVKAQNGYYSRGVLSSHLNKTEMGALMDKLRKPRPSATDVPKSCSAHNCLPYQLNPCSGDGLPPNGLRSSRTSSISSVACRPTYRSVAYRTWSVNGAREYPRFFRSQTDLTAADLLVPATVDPKSTLPPVITSSVTLTRKKVAVAPTSHPEYGSMDRPRTKSLTINRGKLSTPITVYDDQTDFYSAKDYCNFSKQKTDEVKNKHGWGNSLRRLARFRSQSPFAIIRSPSMLMRKLKDTLTSNSTFSLNKCDKNNNIDHSKYKTFGLSEQTSFNNKFQIRSTCDFDDDQDFMDNSNRDFINGTYFCRSNQFPEMDDNRSRIKKGYSVDSSSIHTDSGSSTTTVKFGSREEAIEYVKSQLINIRQRDEEILRQLQTIEARIRLNNAC